MAKTRPQEPTIDGRGRPAHPYLADKQRFVDGQRVRYAHESSVDSPVHAGDLGTVVSGTPQDDGRILYDILWDGAERPVGYFEPVLEPAPAD